MSAAPRLPLGSPMRHRMGWLYTLLGLSFLLRKQRIGPESALRLQRAARKGPLVYVLYRKSLLDWLALARALRERHLPLARATLGLRVPWLAPLSVLWRALRLRLRLGRRSQPELSELLRDGPLCLFLVHPSGPLARQPDAPFEALLAAQERLERPVQLLPVAVIWDRSPPGPRSQLERVLFGQDDWTGRLRKLFLALTGSRMAVQLGEALDLWAFIERSQRQPPARRARLLRVALRHHLARELKVVRGPRLHPHRRMRRTVLSSPEVQRAVAARVESTGRSLAAVQAEARRTLDRIAARPSFTWMFLGDHLTRFLWNRIYSGVDVRDEDVERVREAIRRGTPVLVPSHRSHLDYLLLSSVLYQHDVVLPHVVAGMNLSFWPLGAVLRRLGAVFIERSFRGKPLFAAVFSRYLQELLRQGYPVEFFIEGGRSRTGRLLPPRPGVLGMVLDAAARWARPGHELTLLPVHVGYEQVAEESAYASEIRGQPKQPESVGQLLRLHRVLRHRYGRVYLRVGEPVDARSYLSGLGRPWGELSPEERREAIQQLGLELLARIDRVSVVVPTSLLAAVLLARPLRGEDLASLRERYHRYLAFLQERGAPLSPLFERPDWAFDEALGRFAAAGRLRLVEGPDGPVVRVEEEQRVVLDFYKNCVLHRLAPAALAALARRSGEPERTYARLLRLLRLELVGLQARPPDHAAAQAELALLAGDGEPGRLDELAGLVSNLLETYWLALVAAHRTREQALSLAERAAAIRRLGEGLHAAERLRYPEALSLPGIRQALKVYREDGLYREEGQRLAFDEERYRAMRAEIEALLFPA